MSRGYVLSVRAPRRAGGYIYRAWTLLFILAYKVYQNHTKENERE